MKNGYKCSKWVNIDKTFLFSFIYFLMRHPTHAWLNWVPVVIRVEVMSLLLQVVLFFGQLSAEIMASLANYCREWTGMTLLLPHEPTFLQLFFRSVVNYVSSCATWIDASLYRMTMDGLFHSSRQWNVRDKRARKTKAISGPTRRSRPVSKDYCQVVFQLELDDICSLPLSC